MWEKRRDRQSQGEKNTGAMSSIKAKHFTEPGHEFDRAIKIIDIIGNPDCQKVERVRLQQKTHWIINLQTLHPLEINARLGRPRPYNPPHWMNLHHYNQI